MYGTWVYRLKQEEVTLSGYKRHLASEKAPQPLTRAEEELNEVKASEHRTEISIETKHQVWTLTEHADFLFITGIFFSTSLGR